jgi:hypothetical protein
MEIYQFSENERFTYEYDTDTPLDFFTGGLYFVQILLGPRGRYGYNSETLPEIENAVKRFEESYLTDDSKLRAVRRYAMLSGYAGIAETVRGYSQGEWLDVFVYCPSADAENLPAYLAEFENYFRGDVYNVTFQRSKVFTAADGETVTIWQDVDTIGGFITDDQNKLNEYAFEAFCK